MPSKSTVVVVLLLVILLLLVSDAAWNSNSPTLSTPDIVELDVHTEELLLWGRDPRKDAHLNFLVIGDWGMPSRVQEKVAKQLGLFAQSKQAQMVLSAGDNMYSWGVKTPEDPLWYDAFERPFSYPNTPKEFEAVPWYPVLGNHDCRGSKDAQVAYSLRSPRWRMRAAFSSFSVPLGGGQGEVGVWLLDSCALVCPPVSQVPTAQLAQAAWAECEVAAYAKPGQEAAAHAAYSQSRSAQLAWLRSSLQKDKSRWKIVVGHHAIHSASLMHGPIPILRQDLLPILQEGNVDLYFSGHDHSLQHIHLANETSNLHHVTSGGGGYMTGFTSMHWIDPNYQGLEYGLHTFGFISVNVSKSALSLEFIDYRGRVIYSHDIVK